MTSVPPAGHPVQLSCPFEADGRSYNAVEESEAEILGMTEGAEDV